MATLPELVFLLLPSPRVCSAIPCRFFFSLCKLTLFTSAMPGIDISSNRTAATDDDGVDHIGTDTPASGVATPQPDLQDKRLPGIMSYFGQVRSDSAASQRPAFICPPEEALLLAQRQGQQEKSLLSSAESHPSHHTPATEAHSQGVPDLKHLVISHASPSSALSMAQAGNVQVSSYPTPPTSQPSSSHGSEDARPQEPRCIGGEVQGTCTAAQSPSADPSKHRQGLDSNHSHSALAEVSSQAVTELDRVTRQVGLHDPTSSDGTEAHSGGAHCTSSVSTTQASGKWFSLDGLRELTRGVMFKSGTSTPTRALSAAQPSQSEGRQTPSRRSHDDGTASGTQTPRGANGAQAPASKGRLTIKITEARGLRKSRDPYVVAVFQRSELISGGPRPGETEEPLNAATSAMGGIPISRQGSDSGRPMAIPMRSRQSSNTSISDYNTFRNRPSRQSFTNPTWDAEAVL